MRRTYGDTRGGREDERDGEWKTWRRAGAAEEEEEEER